jgi:hypothetical protein
VKQLSAAAEADVANHIRAHGFRPDPFFNSQNMLMLQTGESIPEFKHRMVEWHRRQRAMVNSVPAEYRRNPVPKNYVTFPFLKSQVVEMVQRTMRAKKHLALCGKDPLPALWLVKDHGVYLMSSAKPSPAQAEKKAKIIFASGFRPGVYDYWDLQKAIGGDDFAEGLFINDGLLKKLAQPGIWFVVRMSADDYEVTVEQDYRR